MRTRKKKSMTKGRLFVISGPSGCGKSTVLAKVFTMLDNYYFSVSATTRAPRNGETEGKDYFFVSRDEFLRMIENGELLEHAEYVGNFYGTPLKPILENVEAGTDVFLDIETKGKSQVDEKYPEAVTVFIAPPSLEELEKRLRSRGTESDEKVKKRLEKAAEELKLSNSYDHVIINDTVDNAAEQILAIVRQK